MDTVFRVHSFKNVPWQCNLSGFLSYDGEWVVGCGPLGVGCGL